MHHAVGDVRLDQCNVGYLHHCFVLNWLHGMDVDSEYRLISNSQFQNQ